MATQSLYRRYRPRRFDELRGQGHVVRALRDSIANGREGQAYLFSGPRGTGKTTTARIMAKALNCEHVEGGEPCGQCESCLAIDNGTSYDVHELDAASNNGVDAIRDLIEKASLGTPGRHKVYILDEVHMLSNNAEAALLKTLEEPPPHVVFVLATTDPQKMSDTIRSRTQHLQFHLLPADELDQHIQWVAKDAGYDLPPDAFEAALERGGGSARDTLSALELIASTGGAVGEVTDVDGLLTALIDADAAGALTRIAAGVSQGLDPRGMAEDLVRHLRNGFLSLVAPDVVVMSPDRRAALTETARQYGAPRLVRAIEHLGTTLTDLRNAPDPRVLVEIALVQLIAEDGTDKSASKAAGQSADQSGSANNGDGHRGGTSPQPGVGGPELAGLVARLERLEQQLAQGGRGVASPASHGHSAASPIHTDTHATTPTTTEQADQTSDVEGAAQVDAAQVDADRGSGRKVLGGAAQRARQAAEQARAGDQVVASSPPDEPTSASSEVPSSAVAVGEGSSDTPAAQPTPAAQHSQTDPSEAGTGAATQAGSTTPSGAHRSVLEVWPEVRSSLKPLARAVYSAGEMTEPGPGRAVLVVGTETQASKCLEHRKEVAAALSSASGSTIELDVVAGGGATPTGQTTSTGQSSTGQSSPSAAPHDGSAGSVPSGATGHRVSDTHNSATPADHRHDEPEPEGAAPAPSSPASSVAATSPDESTPNEFAQANSRVGSTTADTSSRNDDATAASEPELVSDAELVVEPEFEDESSIDLDDLVDAPPESYKGPAEKLAEAFPGLEQIEEDW